MHLFLSQLWGPKGCNFVIYLGMVRKAMLRNKGVVVFNKQPMSRVGKRWCSRGTTRYGYLYWFPESAVTDYHELGGFKENTLLVFFVFCSFFYSLGYGFSSGHVWMWELDCEESWALKNWCFWTVVLEKTLESSLDCKEIQPVHSKGDQPWVFFGRNGAKAETPVLWLPDAKSWLIGRDSDAGRDWGQE